MRKIDCSLKQNVISDNPKDAIEPHGYIFAFRGETMARVVFNDMAVRDVLLSDLSPCDDELCGR
jgi:hypothetical protein